MSHRIYLGIGSNIEPRRHICCGLDALAASFCLEQISSVYQSEAVGFDGSPFLNCVVAIASDASLPALAAHLRAIEFRYGRTANCTKFSSRQLDIDILTYDDLWGTHHGITLPRGEITANAYVLCPFAEIAGDLRLPGESRTLSVLWSRYGETRQPLKRVGFVWRDRALPMATATLHQPRPVAIDS